MRQPPSSSLATDNDPLMVRYAKGHGVKLIQAFTGCDGQVIKLGVAVRKSLLQSSPSSFQ